jgi:hypothetical protein
MTMIDERKLLRRLARVRAGLTAALRAALSTLLQGKGLPPIAYIAMPYRGASEWEVVQHVRAAEALALKYWRKGYAVICPHKNTALMGGAAPCDTWLHGDLALLARCDVIVMGPGWRGSEGACTELEHARAWGIGVIIDDEEA